MEDMRIEDLRDIGNALFAMAKERRLSKGAGEVLGRGAGGDKTYAFDREAEEIILSGIEKLGEPVSFISEETGMRQTGEGPLRVIIDPIDGSRNAVSGIPVFCSSIAVANGATLGDVFLSYVINLANGDEFWAKRGEGSFWNGVKMRCQESDEYKVILYETQSPSKDLARILPVLSLFTRTRCLGATALDLCCLALGAASACVIPSPSRSFDFAGGWLIAKEAGAVVTDVSGGEIENIELGLGRSAPLLATGHGAIHKKLVSLLAENE